jgi:hypothetical protein
MRSINSRFIRAKGLYHRQIPSFLRDEEIVYDDSPCQTEVHWFPYTVLNIFDDFRMKLLHS